jgi:hypothetical protein
VWAASQICVPRKGSRHMVFWAYQTAGVVFASILDEHNGSYYASFVTHTPDSYALVRVVDCAMGA